MLHLSTLILATVLASSKVHAAPTGPSPPQPTVPPASNSPNPLLWSGNSPLSDSVPQPLRDTFGATILGPQNVPVALENADLLAPPTTDHGSVKNAHWPFALSHNRLQTGGWARQQNVNTMPIATELAGVNMRLEAGGIRELHWHTTAEWAYVLKGSAQISTVTPEGQNYVGVAHQGDLWYFPPGQPHSLQGTADDPHGTEFLLVFDSGAFDEGATLLLTDWLSHVPKEVIAKNFQTSIAAFDNIPSRELYIFPGPIPDDNQQPPVSPYGKTPDNYTYAFSQQPARQVGGGTVKIADSTTFKVAKTIAVAEITVVPGALRELHWHPTQDEWAYIIEGQARMTLFAGQSNARTFDYQAGDIAYIPASFGHYFENTGNTTLHFLEIYKTDRYSSISLSQWLALTPPELVRAHLGVSNNTLDRLNQFRVDPVVVAPSAT